MLYKRALGEKTESAWEEYRRANKEAKKVVEEAKEEELVRFEKEMQKEFLRNRRILWRKVKGKEEVPKCGLGIESEDGTYLTN